ncbi:MAG: response regulator [Candidatus Latescibacteria bacterium]|nr:response regulator [Candidatus Latescibacterota bacterium]
MGTHEDITESKQAGFLPASGEGGFFLPVHLNKLAEQMISLTQPKWKDQAMANGVTLDIRTDLQAIPVIAGNETELREMLTNLIFNAVDAMPHDGAITLRTRHEGEHVLLEVKDTGIGMTEEVRERCLEPFFSTKGEQGTGLGLAMVFGILQRHEGEIDIQSRPGEGTTFSIRLPVLKEQMELVPPQEAATPSAGLRILVVDDDPRVRETIRAFLVSDKHEAEVAFKGREGLEKFHAGNYDIVMTDRAMPEMSGDHLAAAIKKLAPHKPVIMLTGFGDMMEAADEHPGGVDVILSKPVSLVRLREALAKASRHLRAHSTGELRITTISSTAGRAI